MKRKALIISIIIIVILASIGAFLWFRPAQNVVQQNAGTLPGGIVPNIEQPLTPTPLPAQNNQVLPSANTGNAVNNNTSKPVEPSIATTPSDLFSYLGMTKDQIIKKLGKSFQIVDTGAEGTCTGFYYKNVGLVFTFNDFEEENPNAKVAWIDCDKSVAINGAKTGMNFAQIQEKLGSSPINDTFYETEDIKAYKLEYTINNCLVRFLSFSKDGEESILTIMKN